MTFRLKFTGNCNKREFERACAGHDFWYHSYYFDNGYTVVGDYDIGLNIGEYGFPTDMTGMRVLDIGTGSGWFAHYFEQLGADVTTTDARGYCDFDVRERFEYPPVESEKHQPDRIEDGKPVYFSPVSGGFWTMKDILGSKVRYVNSRVYDVADALPGEKFDLVFMGALLLHLRDPVGALMAARRVCGDRFIATTSILEDGAAEPRMTLYTQSDLITWWCPNEACFRHWFIEAGFPMVDISRKVVLTSDHTVPSTVFEGPRNPTQTVRVGDARIPSA